MPKRQYPFEQTLVMQRKIHVGPKEVAAAPSGQDQMKAVYEKTVRLLFEGARNLPTSSPIIGTSAAQETVACTYSGLRQMRLTTDGKLDGNKLADYNHSDCPSTSTGLSSASKCYFCEQSFSENCMHACVHCKEYFCEGCSIAMYECKEEMRVCHNCYR